MESLVAKMTSHFDFLTSTTIYYTAVAALTGAQMTINEFRD